MPEQDFIIYSFLNGRADQYGFMEVEDFTLHKFVGRGATKIDCHISTDMTKELSMVERNENATDFRGIYVDSSSLSPTEHL